MKTDMKKQLLALADAWNKEAIMFEDDAKELFRVGDLKSIKKSQSQASLMRNCRRELLEILDGKKG